MSTRTLISITTVLFLSASMWSQGVIIDTTDQGDMAMHFADGSIISLNNPAASTPGIRVTDTPFVQSLNFDPAGHTMGFSEPNFSWDLLPLAGPTYSGIRHVFSNEQRHFYIDQNGDTIEVVITPGEHKMDIGADLSTDKLEVRDDLIFLSSEMPVLLSGEMGFDSFGEMYLRRKNVGTPDLAILFESGEQKINLESGSGGQLEFDLSAPDRIVVEPSYAGVQLCGPIYEDDNITFTLPNTPTQSEMRYLFSDDLHHVWINASGDTVKVVVTPGQNKMTFVSDVSLGLLEARDQIDVVCGPAYDPNSTRTQLYCNPSDAGMRCQHVDLPDLELNMDPTSQRVRFATDAGRHLDLDLGTPGRVGLIPTDNGDPLAD
ncbi:MAG: hypothetical protein R3330_10120, partial [Saprospiraceae bacterium]|nr:hypothetical protein [Saprospiraceae bacterium]